MRIIFISFLSATMVYFILVAMSQLAMANDSQPSQSANECCEEVLISESDLMVKKPIENTKPKEPVKQPELSQPVTDNSTSESPQSDIPVLETYIDMDTGITTFKPSLSPAIEPSTGSGAQSSDIMPAVQVEPLYPEKARARNIEGWVKLSFDVDESGMTRNITVIDAEPKNIFNRAAIRAIKKWKYKSDDHSAIMNYSSGHQITLEFNLENN